MATELTDTDVDRIADALADKLKVRLTNNFYIGPEEHYQDHMKVRRLDEIFDEGTAQSLKDLAHAYRAGRGRFFVIFVSLVIMGTIAIAGYAIWSGGKVSLPSHFPGKHQ